MLVIFDWDGTLADSTDHIVAAMQAAIAEMGLEFRSDEICRAQIGLGLGETARSLFPQLPEERVNTFRQTYSKRYLALGKDQFKLCLYEGALQALTRLRDSGHQLAIATGKSRAGLNRVLNELELADRFVATRASDETASKPDPLMLNELLRETGFTASQAVMIGDSSYDLAMAQSIGMPRIGVSYGVHSVEKLSSYKPAAIANSVIELPGHIQSLPQ